MWAGLENASGAKKCVGCSSSKGAGMNSLTAVDPENACGISATILSMVDKKGRFDGSSCDGRRIFSGSRFSTRSLPSISTSSARRWQRALSASVGFARSVRASWKLATTSTNCPNRATAVPICALKCELYCDRRMSLRNLDVPTLE